MRHLKIVHSLGWYFPESSGGTEVYVDGLVKALARRQIDSEVAAAISARAPETYAWDGIGVHRYVVPDAAPGEMAGGRPHGHFEEFARWLESRAADVYHQHSWTRGCGLHHLRCAKELGLRTVLTVHVPGVVCVRGTMMLHGETPCDGRIDTARCTECWSAARGVPARVAAWQVRHPTLSSGAARVVPPSRLRTILRTPALVDRHREQLLAAAEHVDKVVAVCGWLHDALGANGVPREKLVCCRQGADTGIARRRSASEFGRPPRVGFLGRWDPTKGIHILVDAFRQLPPEIDARLAVHALPGDAAYERDVRAAAAADSRIEFGAPVGRTEIGATLAGFDVLAVPSQWLETGPLVALEAFAVGVPVLGSNLGGIAELVREENGGWLVPHNDVGAWTRAIARALSTTPRLTPEPPRSVDDVADEMCALYQEICSRRVEAPAMRESRAEAFSIG